MIRIPKNKIAVTPLRDPEVTKGGIIIPDIAKERVDQGLVKYKGSSVSDEIEIGDHVIFSGYAGSLVHIEEEGTLIIVPEDVVAAKIMDFNFDLRGIYFKDARTGEYFEASYESLMEEIAHQVTHSKEFRAIQVKTPKLRPEEIDRDR